MYRTGKKKYEEFILEILSEYGASDFYVGKTYLLG